MVGPPTFPLSIHIDIQDSSGTQLSPYLIHNNSELEINRRELL